MNKQRGISLIVVLIGLVIISFAAVALLRSTDTATLIAGNLGFKKAALASGDFGSEAAITWLNANVAGNTLFSDQEASGYFASSRDGCDLTGTRTPDPDDDVDWAGGAPKEDCNVSALTPAQPASVTAAGNSIAYVVNRMCNAEGDPNSALASDGVTAMICSRAEGVDEGGGSKSGCNIYTLCSFSGSSKTYYRITTRIAGPRNTVRYVQAWVVL